MGDLVIWGVALRMVTHQALEKRKSELNENRSDVTGTILAFYTLNDSGNFPALALNFRFSLHH